MLKGGVLLAALDARRPTRDIDLASRALENSAAHVFGLIREIAAIERLRRRRISRRFSNS